MQGFMERNFRNFRFSWGGYFSMEHKDTKFFFVLAVVNNL